MAAGYRGAFVIAAGQTAVDGLGGARLRDLVAGSVWRWWGEPVRIDGPVDVLLLDGARGGETLRRHAARSAARLLGNAAARAQNRSTSWGGERSPHGFTVTDGVATFSLAVIDDVAAEPLLLVSGALPPRDRDLTVIDCTIRAEPRPGAAEGAGVICFARGTMIATPDGPRAIETLWPGARVATRDDGAQDVLWIGARRMSGARLHALPALRPVRIRAGAFGAGRPQGELLVSPDHRILVTGAEARELFGEAELLVAARDLIDGRRIVTDMALREVTYVHLLTERHQVIWANGLETETFHPASADLGTLDPLDRAELLALVAGLDRDPFRYGDYARRALTGAEAAILRHAAA